MPESRQTPATAKPAHETPASPPPDRLAGAPGFLVVGIGASAGGLDACKKLVSAVPAGHGMAFILVQHLDPTHPSMMVDLLASAAKMPVLQAAEGMRVEPDHLYVIPPGVYLSVKGGALRVTPPLAPHGARLPFDFLLQSMALDYGARAAAVVLSGTGTDGSAGVQAIKASGGLVIAQDLIEAEYDGMPRGAIAAKAVEFVLPAAKIAEALAARQRDPVAPESVADAAVIVTIERLLPDIIDLLRAKTAHDFTFYKPGTLERRIARRMGMASIASIETYLGILREDAGELEALAKDLLINVTSFFRDTAVFDALAKKWIPGLIGKQPSNGPLRVWVAGCSSGEETYSLAMLLREEITASRRDIKLQIFASDVDPDAVATARDGRYSRAIEAQVTPARLARFFSKEENGYRVLPDLRASIVFTVQDLLADPPFSRLDFISCRNLLIYLKPEAQAKVLSVFQFALREGGLLLLGNSETAGADDGLFAVVSKAERLYARAGRGRASAFSLSPGAAERARKRAKPADAQAPSRQAALAELFRRRVSDAYAPAAVLINQKYECLFFQGPIDRFLKAAPGPSANNLIAMAREGLGPKLRSAATRAFQERAAFVAPGGRISAEPSALAFDIAVEPVSSDGEEYLLICFVEKAKPPLGSDAQAGPLDARGVAELERELRSTRTQLEDSIRNLETSSEEQMAINEEALSVNEEFQSTNEELLASKEELQSLNEELTALNSQLQETLERQRTTSGDLQNVLYSTNVATIFLDLKFNIRFFTPATRSLFNILPGDVGRPLTDLNSLAADSALMPDAQTVLLTGEPLEREIEARSGAWFMRRILPYRAHDGAIEGIVITFADITTRRAAAELLDAAKREAELASVAKSRFLAAASHDLRQPLQTLALLQGLLARNVTGEKAQKLVRGMDDSLGAMTGMLNTLLDINQIEIGAVRAEISAYPVNDLLGRLRDELSYQAQARGIELRVMPCGLSVRSDPRLLEQMVRNLASNALKYTQTGKVLIGCRRRAGAVRIEVWDTGIGIPAAELQAIFDEYHQIDNPARERARGLGLGLSIVKSLGTLLECPVRVRSRVGKGSVFSIEVKTISSGIAAVPPLAREPPAITPGHASKGAILVVEDDPEVRHLLALFLRDEGYAATTAFDAAEALELIQGGAVEPDLILTDYNLPNGMDGVTLTAELRARLNREFPAVILTGDISKEATRNIALHNCVHLSKPVKLTELARALQKLVQRSLGPPAAHPLNPGKEPSSPLAGTVYVVDDDKLAREGMRAVLEDDGRLVETFATCEAFLGAFRPRNGACLLIDAYLPGMSGLELLRKLREGGHQLPAIMITGNSDVAIAVSAMKAGASDFIEKPVSAVELLASLDRALELSSDSEKIVEWRESAARHLAGLTPRQREVMERVLAGHPSKNIAADLGISQRTVENHRAAIMKRAGVKSLPALARLAVAAAGAARGASK